jgi:hypothetical protein
MSPDAVSNVSMLAAAGLVNAANLTTEDQAVIAQLSEAEVTTLISIATRLYPDKRTMLKEHDLLEGVIRLFVPL